MSEAVSALKNAVYIAGIAEISEMGAVGMITLRGDLAAKPLQKAAVAAAGVNVPDQRQCLTEGTGGMAWMSPDELLIMCAYDDANAKLADLRDKLAGTHALAVNVSDARAVFEVRGVFRVVCFRSVAQYVCDVLCVAAQPGSEVGVF